MSFVAEPRPGTLEAARGKPRLGAEAPLHPGRHPMAPELIAVRALVLGVFALLLVPLVLLLFPSADLTDTLALRHCYAGQRGAALGGGVEKTGGLGPPPCRPSWASLGTPPRWFCPAHGFVDRPSGLGPEGNAWMDLPGDGRPVLLPSPREQLEAAGSRDPDLLALTNRQRLRVLPSSPSVAGWVAPEIQGSVLYPLGLLLVLAGLCFLGRAATAASGGDRPSPTTIEEALERHAPEIGAQAKPDADP